MTLRISDRECGAQSRERYTGQDMCRREDLSNNSGTPLYFGHEVRDHSGYQPTDWLL